jgi:hypothetical protein
LTRCGAPNYELLSRKIPSVEDKLSRFRGKTILENILRGSNEKHPFPSKFVFSVIR